ncbi:uncharacterized protein C5orf52 homolog isoform X2 [Ranitomeya variabilis]
MQAVISGAPNASSAITGGRRHLGYTAHDPENPEVTVGSTPDVTPAPSASCRRLERRGTPGRPAAHRVAPPNSPPPSNAPPHTETPATPSYREKETREHTYPALVSETGHHRRPLPAEMPLPCSPARTTVTSPGSPHRPSLITNSERGAVPKTHLTKEIICNNLRERRMLELKLNQISRMKIKTFYFNEYEKKKFVSNQQKKNTNWEKEHETFITNLQLNERKGTNPTMLHEDTVLNPSSPPCKPHSGQQQQ